LFGTVLGAGAGATLGAGTGALRTSPETPEASSENSHENNDIPPVNQEELSNNYYQALAVPISLRTPEQNTAIYRYQNLQSNEALDRNALADVDPVNPMEDAQSEINKAGEEAAAKGGDALDIANAKGAKQAVRCFPSKRSNGFQ
jgi:hypothetical protein